MIGLAAALEFYMPYPGPVLVAIFVVVDLYCFFPPKFLYSQCAGVDWSTRASFANRKVYSHELLISYIFQWQHSPHEIGAPDWQLGIRRETEPGAVRSRAVLRTIRASNEEHVAVPVFEQT